MEKNVLTSLLKLTTMSDNPQQKLKYYIKLIGSRVTRPGHARAMVLDNDQWMEWWPNENDNAALHALRILKKVEFNVDTPGQRLQQWPTLNQYLGECLVFAG